MSSAASDGLIYFTSLVIVKSESSIGLDFHCPKCNARTDAPKNSLFLPVQKFQIQGHLRGTLTAEPLLRSV